MLNWLLGRKPKLRDVRGAPSGVPVHHIVYENKKQPDGYGAARYAYELLQLTPSSPIDRAVRVRKQITQPFSGPQIWAGQAVRVNPIPSMANGIYSGGMVNADGSLPMLGPDGSIDWAGVAQNFANAGANSAASVYGPNDPMGAHR